MVATSACEWGVTSNVLVEILQRNTSYARAFLCKKEPNFTSILKLGCISWQLEVSFERRSLPDINTKSVNSKQSATVAQLIENALPKIN